MSCRLPKSSRRSVWRRLKSRWCRGRSRSQLRRRRSPERTRSSSPLWRDLQRPKPTRCSSWLRDRSESSHHRKPLSLLFNFSSFHAWGKMLMIAGSFHLFPFKMSWLKWHCPNSGTTICFILRCCYLSQHNSWNKRNWPLQDIIYNRPSCKWLHKTTAPSVAASLLLIHLPSLTLKTTQICSDLLRSARTQFSS